MTQMSATEAARAFSDVLNRVASGENIEVVRNGAAVALIAAPKPQVISAARFREVLASAPRPDDDFAADIRAARAELGPPLDSWPS